MGNTCSGPDDNHHTNGNPRRQRSNRSDVVVAVQGRPAAPQAAPTIVSIPPPSPAPPPPPPPRRQGKRRRSKRGDLNNGGGGGGGIRNSIRRVGSRVWRSSKRSAPDRASNYNHVQSAVMDNIAFAGAQQSLIRNTPFGVVGMQNLGNTCFLNSSLQCLSNTIPLTDYFLGYDYKSEINHDNVLGTGGKLVMAYAEFIKTIWLGQTTVVSPSRFKQRLSVFAPQFNGNRQHDAQELLAFLLDGIHEDLNRVKNKPYIEDKDCDGTQDEFDAMEAWKNYLRRDKSLIVDIFQGQFRNTCRCKTCGHVNIRFEPFMYLSLPINHKCKSLQDCMELYLQQDELTGTNQWYCEKCKKHVDATRKIDIWVVPPILIVHLKRFRYDDFGRVGSKNEASLHYPLQQWDLSKHVVSQHGEEPVYDLYAVANHMGGLGSGHYIAHALNRFDDKWYEFNDSRYREVDSSALRHGSSAYVLFYNRSESVQNDSGSGPGSGGNGRNLLIRRQSVSRPDLWPHAQVRTGEFRGYTRPSARNLMPVDGVEEEDEMMQGRRRAGSGEQHGPPREPRKPLSKISERTELSEEEAREAEETVETTSDGGNNVAISTRSSGTEMEA